MAGIKICFATREYAHPDMSKTGGIGVFVKQFSRYLQHCGFDVTVFSFGMDSVSFDDEGINVIRIKDLSSFNEAIKTPLRRNKIPGYISIKLVLEFINRVYISIYLSLFVWRRQFDLIEFHDYGGDFPYFFGKLPKVVRCHGSALTLHQFMGYVDRVSDSIFEKQFFNRFNKYVIAVSEYAAKTTQKAFMLKYKPTVIYNGIALPEMQSERGYLETPTIKYSIFYIGAVRERKGIAIACDVFNQILAKFPESTFHVLGNNNNDYWNTNALKLLTDEARAKTTYYGTVPNEDVNNYIKKAHVVLFPSFGENFSMALLEVMALGKIAVTSNISSFKEIIIHEHNGLMAQELNDYETLITNVFVNQVDVCSLSTNAIETIKSRFESTQIIEENVRYYKTLL